MDNFPITRTIFFLPDFSHMVQNISYIDRSRIAVWGWSYGGYLAGQMLAEDNQNLLSCAVSVAPVVKWQLYGMCLLFFID